MKRRSRGGVFGPSHWASAAVCAPEHPCGSRLHRGGLGVDPDTAPPTRLRGIAEKKGKAAGVVTSVEWTHATPAAFVAHNEARGDHEAIGKEMVLDSATDVILGCGHPWYGYSGEKKTTPNTYGYGR